MSSHILADTNHAFIGTSRGDAEAFLEILGHHHRRGDQCAVETLTAARAGYADIMTQLCNGGKAEVRPDFHGQVFAAYHLTKC